MSIIKKNDIKKMDHTQLNQKLLDLKRELVKINAQVAIGTIPENPGKVKEVKRTIARLNFALKNKPMQQENKKAKEVKIKA